MKTWSCLLLVMAAFLLGGCSMPEMKGTPFYTGTYKLDIPEADVNRVNLWPLAYYREPVLSVLWPIFEKTEEHVAARPLFSAYGDTEDYWEYNFLWPLGQWDSLQHANRLFPYFWGSVHRAGNDLQPYHILFPFWWHFEEELNTFVPLWYVRHSNWQNGAFTEHSRWYGGPLAHIYESPEQVNWHVGPFGASTDRDGSSSLGCYPFPLYVTWRDEKRSGVFTPLYAQSVDEDEGWSLFPPLLYLHTWDSKSDDRWLGGPLFHSCSGADLNGWHALLFWRYRSVSDDSDFAGYPFPFLMSWRNDSRHGFFTPLYATSHDSDANDRNGWSLIPALLSWHAWNPESDRYWVAGPLGHYRRSKSGQAWHAGPFGSFRNDESQTRCSGFPWPLMFSWQSPRQRGIFTPVFASCERTAASEPTGWSVSPLLLSWHLWSGEEHDYWLGGPLAHLSTGGSERSWHAGPFGHIHDAADGECYNGYPWPLIFSWSNPKRQGFFSPLYAYLKDSETCAVTGDSLLPPLLYWHWWTPTEDSHWLLGPLAHYRRGLDLEGWHVGPFGHYRKPKSGTAYGGYPWPLAFTWKSREGSGFFSPLYGYQRDTGADGEEGWGTIPLLLAWREWNKGQDDLYGLLGLYSRHVENGAHYGHLLPFYAYDEREGRFLSLLAGWQKPDQKHASGFWYPFTPLVGVRTGAEEGGWLFPIYSHSHKPGSPDYSTSFLLAGYMDHSETRDAQSETRATHWGFLPFYSHSYETFTNSATAWSGRMESRTHDDYAFLLGFSLRNKTVRYAPRGEAPPAGTNESERVRLEEWHANRARGDVVSSSLTEGFVPFWLRWSTRETRLDGTLLSSTVYSRLLLILYDNKETVTVSTNTAAQADYQRQRVLWKVWHYERRNGDTSIDIFPFITRDTHADGLRKTTFLWRLFRYQKDPDGKTSLDLFFLPLVRTRPSEA